MSCMKVLPAARCRFSRPYFCKVGQSDRLAVGEFGNKGQAAAHCLDGLSQGGKQKISALFEARNAVLSDAQSLGYADLGKLARAPELPQGHFLGNQLSR